MIIGIDTGGTFTDFIFRANGRWEVRKIPSTPENPAEAVLDGLSAIPGAGAAQIVHGSTVATNAVLERRGARTALVTNSGFADILAIGRQQRARLYDPFFRRQPPLVPEELRLGVSGRINAAGEVIEAPSEAELDAAAGRIAEAGVESVAVSLLFSFANPVHEKRIEAALARLDIPVSLSHRILPEFREYERTSTTVINAYVAPRTQRYIRQMAGRIPRSRLRIMQSNGGSISADRAAEEPVRTILSGPAGGVVGARAVGAAAGYDRLISFDMGGTSTDVSLIDRGLPISAESAVDGFPVNVPMLDIHTVGAGGGSIARIDAAGALKVGPQSAGAFPGPMCYGNGSKLTVTDANLFLGRLQPDLFLGGRMQLETSGVIREMGRMAASAGLSPASLARGILSVANAAMERAIRRISVERGRDPQAFTLLAFGGAGGLHAAFLARLLGMKRICVPRHPGILSAAGMLAADVVRDYSQTVMLDPAETDAARLDALFENLTRQAKSEMAAEGLQESGVEMKRSADMRYKGQSYEIRVDFDTDCIARFHRAHEERYGFSDPAQPVELVNIRLRAVCPPPEKMALTRMPEKGPQVPESAFLGRRPVGFSSDAVPTPVFDRSRLLPGNRIQGPAIAVEYSSTVVVPPDAEARVDGYENILITLGQSPAPGQEKEQGRHGSRRA